MIYTWKNMIYTWKPGAIELWLLSCLDAPRNTAVLVPSAGELEGGLPVTLTCSSDANPPVCTYTWYQGAACLPAADKSFHQGRQSLAATGRGQTLSSVNITTDGHGQHCCVARNRHGSQTSTVSLGGSSSRFMMIHIICILQISPAGFSHKKVVLTW